MRLVLPPIVFLGVALALAGCLVIDDPLALPNPAGPDAGLDSRAPGPGPGGGSGLPLIDQYAFSSLDLPVSVNGCAEHSSTTLDRMGGGYANPSSLGTGILYRDRNGATLSMLCIPNGPVSVVLMSAMGLTGALNAQNDEARLNELCSQDRSERAVSPAADKAPKLRYAQRFITRGAEDQATCSNRALKAIVAALDKLPASPNRWTRAGAPLLAAGGTDGTTATIACVGAPALLSIVLQIATIDPAADPNALIDTFDTAYTTQ